MKAVLLYGLLCVSCICLAQSKAKDTIKVFFLGGQSNMAGRGLNKDLPASLNKTFPEVWIFNGNSAKKNSKSKAFSKWENLKPGHGAGLKSFGVELSFAKKLLELYPNEKIALIKYARGGTSIDTMANRKTGYWDPDYRGNQGVKNYDLFLKTVKSAFNEKDINGDGIEDYLISSGIIWMQGESDGNDEEVASRYYFNLKRLMDLCRATFRDNYLPVVIGRISDSGNDEDGKVWDYGKLVQYAQEKYAKLDDNAIIVRSTKDYDYSDPWHYDSKAYIDLGEKFAEAVYYLNNPK